MFMWCVFLLVFKKHAKSFINALMTCLKQNKTAVNKSKMSFFVLLTKKKNTFTSEV